MDFFESFASKSDQEMYTTFPPRYKPGKKYIVIIGTVMSGLGKGIIGSALARLLKENNYRVTQMKFDGYLNIDAGTLNPFRHGEVFVLDDGTECDMDLGTYERFLDRNLTRDNYLTAGKLFKNILDKERRGDYLGRDVQFIPHVTGEIKGFVRKLSLDSDIVIVEVGGTAGDIENSYFIEAMREFRHEEGRENVCFIVVTYIIEPKILKEQKSKPAQLGLRALMASGIQPDFVACRAQNPVSKKIIEKISIYSNVPSDHAIDVHDVESVYKILIMMYEAGFDKSVLKNLGLESREINVEKWKNFVGRILNPKKEIKVAMAGKYTALRDSYASILKALEHCAAETECRANIDFIDTSDPEKINLEGVDGIIVPGGFGTRGIDGKIRCAQYAREKNIPYLGLCLGFQTALIDIARNKCGLVDAHTTEVTKTNNPIICILPGQNKEEMGGTLRLGGQDVVIKEGTLAHKLYGSTKIRERFRHRYECNPDYVQKFEDAGVVFSGTTPDKSIMQILELPEHKFFMASQFHPEFTSRPMKPNPLFLGFVAACLDLNSKTNSIK